MQIFMEYIVKLCQVFINDKILVILCATSIALIALILGCSPESKEIVLPVITGLMGVAVGSGMRRSGDVPPSKPPEVKP